MISMEEWYKQWNLKKEDIINKNKKNHDKKLEIIKNEISKNINDYFSPKYIKYTIYESKSVVDFSYIYNKVIDGVITTKLTNKKPNVDRRKIIYEYGFNDKDECLYRKTITMSTKTIDKIYVRIQGATYEVKIFNFETKDINRMKIEILSEYYIDDKKRLKTIIRHHSVLNFEKYQWFNDRIAFINCGVKQYLLLTKNKKLI